MRTFVAPRAERALMTVGLVVAALVVALLQPVGGAAAATVPVPKPPSLPTAIEPFPAYQGAQLCAPFARSGPKDLKAVLTATYGTTSYGITRACTGSTATSEHMEGRALDWMVSGTTQKADAKAFLAWLFADDAAGNHYAMARRMGIMYVVWDNRMFRLYDTAQGWTEYDGCSKLTSSAYDTTCHRNHVHFSFTWDGAGARTSYWSGTAMTTPSCPSAASVAAAPALPTTGLEFVPLPPTRILDTAAGIGVAAPCRLTQDAWSGDDRRIDLQVSGVGGVPATGARAVLISLQTLRPNAPDKVYIQPTGSTASRLRASTTDIGLNGLGAVIIPLGSGGRVSLTLSTGATDVSVDVLGYYVVADGSGDLFHPLRPARVLNTVTDGVSLAPGESRTLSLAGVAGIPASGASAVSLAVTLYGGTTAGGVTVFDPDDAAPPATLLSVQGGATDRRTNVVVSRLSASGELVLRNTASGTRDVLVDVNGWWAPGSTPGGSLYKPLPTAEVIDTTEGKGVPARMAAGKTAGVTLAGKGGVPANGVTAVALQATMLSPTVRTAFIAWPAGHSRPTARSASPSKGIDHTALVVAPLVSGQVALQNVYGTAGLRAYAVGYWYLP
jgi:hypothetical protein